MPTATEMPCPNCAKALKVPESVFGKKIKCKHCGHPFVAEDPAAKAKPAAAKPKADPPKEEPKPAAPASRFADDDDEGDGGAKPKPLSAIEEFDKPRCPHCAKELDPPDAVVCIHCGFNNQTRQKAESKRVWAPDTNDYIRHLAPGVIALVICIALIVLDILCLLNMRDWLSGSFLESNDDDPMEPGKKKLLVRPGAFITLIWAATVMPIVGTAAFAVRRLAIDNKPSEKVKK
ncbi:MAG: hypothetical protein ACKODX_03385 [Gemmata sp.]